MVDSCSQRFEELAKIANELSEIMKNRPIPANYGKNKTVMIHELEQKLKSLVKSIKSLRDHRDTLEKELMLKQESINKGYKSLDQYENKISRSKESYERQAKKNMERQVFVSSVSDFFTSIGFHFDVVKLTEENDSDVLAGIFKIGFSKVCPDNADRIIYITIEYCKKSLKILETDLPEIEDEFRKLEENINNNLKADQINFKGFLTRGRKLIVHYLQTEKKS